MNAASQESNASPRLDADALRSQKLSSLKLLKSSKTNAPKEKPLAMRVVMLSAATREKVASPKLAAHAKIQSQHFGDLQVLIKRQTDVKPNQEDTFQISSLKLVQLLFGLERFSPKTDHY